MTEIPNVYQIESMDQLKAIASELRQRIIHALARQQLTVTQLGDLLDQPPAKLHYHVRELERLGLVVLVETREKGGILEKYYRTRARTLTVPPGLLQERPPDETIAAVSDLLQDVAQGFMQSFAQSAMEGTSIEGTTALLRWHLWMTEEEVATLGQKIATLVEPYEQRRGVEGERELSFVEMLYDPRAATSEGEPDIQSAEGDTSLEDFRAPGKGATVNLQRGRRLRTWTAGVASYGRQELERFTERGAALDIVSFGHVTFMDDVSSDLADRAVYRFRHRGSLSASPAVREVLKRKGEKAQESD